MSPNQTRLLSRYSWSFGIPNYLILEMHKKPNNLPEFKGDSRVVNLKLN